MKTLILLRGLPGSGKSTFAKTICDEYYEADQYFINENGEYVFDASKLKLAHEWCKLRTEHAMEDGVEKIVVSNTFTQAWEMQPYFELAAKYGYRTHSLIIENKHGGKNVHNVPDSKLKEMKDRFQINL